MNVPVAAFDKLSPDIALSAIGEAFNIKPDGSFFAYPSYANRVYGLKDESGEEFVAKFYRPGRWSREAILEEHAFVSDLAASEIPVVQALADEDGETLAELIIESPDGETVYPFALFPKKGGRLFDAENDEDWLRLGALSGRIHTVGALQGFEHRVRIEAGMLSKYATEILDSGAVHPELVDSLTPLFTKAASVLDRALSECHFEPIRLHGDFHRGNVLDRPGSGLLAIDFDDAAMGPAIQDLWLLLPGPVSECRRELGLIVEGYEGFKSLDHSSISLVEPLRLLRMVHFISWQARQRSDRGFMDRFEGWGSKGFWLTEANDIRDQLERIEG